MSKETKFRAFHKKSRQMINPNVLDMAMTLEGELSILENDEETGFLVWGGTEHLKDEYVLMQYTGLKDIDGREIYEGDILKDPHNYNDCCGIIEKEKDTNNLVTTIYYTGLHGDKRLKIPLSCASDYVVVGNIYENPELLEVQND